MMHRVVDAGCLFCHRLILPIPIPWQGIFHGLRRVCSSFAFVVHVQRQLE